jgi:hypothetical protein
MDWYLDLANKRIFTSDLFHISDYICKISQIPYLQIQICKLGGRGSKRQKISKLFLNQHSPTTTGVKRGNHLNWNLPSRTRTNRNTKWGIKCECLIAAGDQHIFLFQDSFAIVSSVTASPVQYTYFVSIFIIFIASNILYFPPTLTQLKTGKGETDISKYHFLFQECMFYIYIFLNWILFNIMCTVIKRIISYIRLKIAVNTSPKNILAPTIE